MEQLPGHTYNFKTLGRVYVSLLILAAVMVGFFLVPMEKLPIDWLDLHLIKRLLILADALMMAAIVSGFLMGLKYEKSNLNTAIFLANFAFLSIFFLFVMADIAFRGVMDPNFTKKINWESPVTKENAKESAQEAPAP